MDNAVALVQAYLRVNGYFTVAEYPVVEAQRMGGHRVATDLDVLAFRFAGAGRLVPGWNESASEDVMLAECDPALGATSAESHMLIGEVKEGRAELNQAATDPAVLRAALTRFGCCPASQVGRLVDRLTRRGNAVTPSGHRIQMIAFGSLAAQGGRAYSVITMGHVVDYLRQYLHEHWSVLHRADSKDPALGFLMTLEKADRGRR